MQDLVALSDRVKVLELEVVRARRSRAGWRKGVLAACVLGALALLVGARRAADPRVISAEAFMLVDAKGTVRALLADDPKRGPGMTFLGPDGHVRIELRGDNNGMPRVTVFGEGTKEKAPFAELHVVSEKPGMILSTGGEGNPEFVTVVSKDGSSYLMMSHGNDIYLDMSSVKNDKTALVMKDRDGKVSAELPARDK